MLFRVPGSWAGSGWAAWLVTSLAGLAGYGGYFCLPQANSCLNLATLWTVRIDFAFATLPIDIVCYLRISAIVLSIFFDFHSYLPFILF